jgi:hypothetical protein
MAHIKLEDDSFGALRGNNAIKAPEQNVYMTRSEAKKIIAEINHCMEDIVYFAEKYFTIISYKGKELITLYPKQKELLEQITQNQNTIVLAARQAGKSTVYTIFALWYAMFHSDKSVLICANKFATAKELMERVQLAYELLPSWLKQGCTEYNKSRVRFENGSRIEISATSASSARGKSGEILIIDEAAFVPNGIMDEFIQSVLPIVSSRPDSKIIVVSTPNGTGNWYAETYNKALYNLGEDGWHHFRIDWWDVPDRDEEWKRKKIAEFNGDLRKFAQEYGNNFLGSSQTLVNHKAIERYKEASEKYAEPEKFPMKDWEALVWYKPVKARTYAIGCDIAEGVGGDYSTAIVMDITDTARIKVCATFANNTIAPTDFSYILAKLATKYNNAIIAGERNGIGRSTMDTIWNVYEMENVLCWKGKNESMIQPGIFSHNNIKVEACIWAKFVLEGVDIFDIEFNDKNILFEIEYFEKKANSTRSIYQAVEGKHDDYIMALIWGLWLIEPTVADFNYVVESTTKTITGIPVPRIIRSDNIMDDEYYSDETKEDNEEYSIDHIYEKMAGSKTRREKPEDEEEKEFSLDDDIVSHDFLDGPSMYEDEGSGFSEEWI